jgi:hypothetical protein
MPQVPLDTHKDRQQTDLENRTGRSARRWTEADKKVLLAKVQAWVAHEMSSDVQFGQEIEQLEASHKKWQAIHTYVQRSPYPDNSASRRSRNWQQAMGLARVIGDLELMEWINMKIDSALRHERWSKGRGAERGGPTFLVLLNNIAARKRKALAALRWAKEAGEAGWITSNTHTLGPNLLKLHAASVYARDNPLYSRHESGPYKRLGKDIQK